MEFFRTGKHWLGAAAIFVATVVHAQRQSANYSVTAEAFAPIAGEANSTDYRQFATAEALAGLSTKDLPDVSNFSGFIGQLPTEPPPNQVPEPPADSDEDGLTDEEEVTLGTDPNKVDTDGDGDSDKAEVDAGTDPKDAASNSNTAPTELAAGFLSVEENKPSGTFVGEFNATDPDANATLTFSLTEGNGSTHNLLFQLDVNGTLKTAAILDHEANASLSIRVRVTDDRNGTFEKPFTVVVLDDASEDADQDGLTDSTELTLGTNPNKADTDEDGHNDKAEVDAGTDPKDPASHPGQPQQPEVPRPAIVRTESITEITGQTAKLSGIVLTKGGSDVTQVGFYVADRILFNPQDAGVIQVAGAWTITGMTFEAALTGLQPDKTYYARAYALNDDGSALSSRKRFKTPPTQSQTTVIEGAIHAGNGWYQSDWFGSFYQAPNGWILSNKLGWIYPSGNAPQGFWYWSKELEWLWTSKQVWPYNWSNQQSDWWYFLGKMGGLRYFYLGTPGEVVGR